MVVHMLRPLQTLCGKLMCDSNVYGHPHPEAVADLNLMIGDSARVLRTDREGTVEFELDEWGVRRVLP